MHFSHFFVSKKLHPVFDTEATNAIVSCCNKTQCTQKPFPASFVPFPLLLSSLILISMCGKTIPSARYHNCSLCSMLDKYRVPDGTLGNLSLVPREIIHAC
jgi:hypothetical protein